MPQSMPTTAPVEERSAERRKVPRVPFKATSVVTEAGSSQIVVAQTSELSRFGCFVETVRPYPQGTRVHIEMSDGGDVFTASGMVAYATAEGMGVVFSIVDSENHEVLDKWLLRTPRRSARYPLGAAAEVKNLGSRNEQVLSTRDLSAGGCFLKTSAPLPKGSQIRVRITHHGEDVTAIGRVTENVSSQGMGVEFIDIEPSDRATLEKWLAHEKVR